jgi:hypothetical protein
VSRAAPRPSPAPASSASCKAEYPSKYIFRPPTVPLVYRHSDRMQPYRYRIAVRGLLDESWSSSFSGMAIIHGLDGMTRLSGSMADQSALHGVLNKLRDLNLEIISVLQLDVDGITPRECRSCGQNKPQNTSFDR